MVDDNVTTTTQYMHELLFITSFNITPVYDYRNVSCTITHFTFAYTKTYSTTGNAMNIHCSKSHINQLRHVTEKTPFTVPGWRGSARQTPPVGWEMWFGRHYLSVLSLIPMIDPGPCWAAGSSSWFKTNYVMMILHRRLWVWCVWLGEWREQDKSPNSVGESTLCSPYYLSMSSSPFLSVFLSLTSSSLISIWTATPFQIINRLVCLSQSVRINILF